MTRGVIDAVVLSGGSLYGLDAAGGVSAVLCAQGRGAMFGGIALPVAVQAILFDLMNGGEKDWIKEPRRRTGRPTGISAATPRWRPREEFALGTVGAGYGATTANLKGGLGSASARTRQGFTVGALAAVNAVGMATIGDGPHFWAASLRAGPRVRRPGLAGRRCRPRRWRCASRASRRRRPRRPSPWWRPTPCSPRPSASGSPSWPMTGWRARCGRCMRPTTATRCSRSATGHAGPGGDPPVLTELGAAAADCLARAVARGVYEATALPYATSLPDYRRALRGLRRRGG